jgi:hypothetical protein
VKETPGGIAAAGGQAFVVAADVTQIAVVI